LYAIIPRPAIDTSTPGRRLLYSITGAFAGFESGAAKVAALKKASPSFVVMRQLAMRFRGLLRGVDPSKLDPWLHDARHSGVRSMQQFARTLSRDIVAIRNAIAKPWSSGQAEGQIKSPKDA